MLDQPDQGSRTVGCALLALALLLGCAARHPEPTLVVPAVAIVALPLGGAAGVQPIGVAVGRVT